MQVALLMFIFKNFAVTMFCAKLSLDCLAF